MVELTALTAAFSTVKALIDLASKGKDLEMKRDLLEIYEKLGDLRQQFHDMQDENFKLQEENRQLVAQLAKKQQGRKHDNAVWKVLDDETEDGPYCPNCYEKTGNFIQPNQTTLRDGYLTFICNEHGDTNFVFRVRAELCGDRPPERKPHPPLVIRTDFPMR
jgi:regulator of replication initiation timing